MDIHNKKILLIGGSGSLGNAFIKKHIENNEIYVYSRDECKHWTMQLQYNNHPNLKFIIGNVCDKDKMQQTVLRHNFHLIINAAAMKHIDKCEFESNECLNTNIVGPQNLVNLIENFKNDLTNLECCCFISTDKACSPVNIYGMSKAISESLFVEKSKYIDTIKFVSVRYGNVLNSRGSIIPMLHELGKNPDVSHFKLTDDSGSEDDAFSLTPSEFKKIIIDMTKDILVSFPEQEANLHKELKNLLFEMLMGILK